MVWRPSLAVITVLEALVKCETSFGIHPIVLYPRLMQGLDRLQALTTRFSRKLRRLAASDHIVKSAGVVGYAQAVLVPELAVRLVKEDMGVSDEDARQILRDSIDLGEKLNFALNDNVPIPEALVGHSVDV